MKILPVLVLILLLLSTAAASNQSSWTGQITLDATRNFNSYVLTNSESADFSFTIDEYNGISGSGSASTNLYAVGDCDGSDIYSSSFDVIGNYDTIDNKFNITFLTFDPPWISMTMECELNYTFTNTHGTLLGKINAKLNPKDGAKDSDSFNTWGGGSGTGRVTIFGELPSEPEPEPPTPEPEPEPPTPPVPIPDPEPDPEPPAPDPEPPEPEPEPPEPEPEPEKRDFAGFLGNFEGEVWIKTPSGTLVKAVLGQEILAGDLIKTGNGKVKFVNEDGIVQVGPNSEFVTVTATGDELFFDLNFGRLKAFFRRALQRRYRIRGPGIAVAVRGTNFMVTHDADTGESSVHVYSGEVLVTDESSGEERTVNSGESVVLQDSLGETQELTTDKWIELITNVSLDEDLEIELAQIELDRPEEPTIFDDIASAVIVIVVLVITVAALFMPKRPEEKPTKKS